MSEKSFPILNSKLLNKMVLRPSGSVHFYIGILLWKLDETKWTFSVQRSLDHFFLDILKVYYKDFTGLLDI